jgi:hypothetical protein
MGGEKNSGWPDPTLEAIIDWLYSQWKGIAAASRTKEPSIAASARAATAAGDRVTVVVGAAEPAVEVKAEATAETDNNANILFKENEARGGENR